jgi:uncharacterized phage infection (PIP) family protein YhgE
MRIKTLRASGLRVSADVAIGSADNGSLVTTHVVIDRHKNEELETALLPLENLLLRTAEERTSQAKSNAIIDARVNERLAKALEPERERVQASVKTQVDSLTASLKMEADNARSRLASLERDQSRLQETASSAIARANDADQRTREVQDQLRRKEAELADALANGPHKGEKQ